MSHDDSICFAATAFTQLESQAPPPLTCEAARDRRYSSVPRSAALVHGHDGALVFSRADARLVPGR